MKDLTLVVMAAGMGSRYGGLKQLDPIGPSGEIILDYSVSDAKKAGFTKVCFIIREDIKDEFHEVIGANLAKHIEVQYAYQRLEDLPGGYTVPEGRGKPWGTGQAVLACKDVVNTPFAVINADDYYGVDAYKLIADQLAKVTNDSFEYCMVGYQLKNTLSDHGHVSRGRCAIENGILKNVVELTKIQRNDGVIQFTEDEENWTNLDENTVVSMNMWGFTPTFFNDLESQFCDFLAERGTEMKSEFYLPFVADKMIQDGKATVTALETEDMWYGVTYPSDKPTVTAAIQGFVDQGTYPAKLWS